MKHFPTASTPGYPAFLLLSFFLSHANPVFGEWMHNLPTVKDTYISAGNPTSGYGSNTSIILTTLQGNLHTALLLQWDVGTILPTATVTSVQITFHKLATDYTGDAVALVLKTPNQAWEENDSWNQVDARGATVVGGVALNPTLSEPVLTSSDYPPLIALVQAWVANPFANHGILLLQAADDPRYISFYTEDSGVKATRLSVEYTLPPPPPFSKLTPANGATEQPTSLTLTWESNPGAASYEICLKTYLDFPYCGSFQSAPFSGTSQNRTGLAPGTTYYWQVRASTKKPWETSERLTTEANGGVMWSFTTGALGTFGKAGPGNGETVHSTSPTLTWGTATNATEYEYCYDTTNDNVCAGNWQSAGSSSSANLVGLREGITYYWQVRARSGYSPAEEADGGVWWSFTAMATDFNGDGKPDILWRHAGTGDNYVWFMNGAARMDGAWVLSVPDVNWKIVGVADFNGDGKQDILWRHATTGENYVWFMNGAARMDGAWIESVPDLNWQIVGVGDFNMDGKPDILWRHATMGQNYVWLMNGAVRMNGEWMEGVSDLNWRVVGIGDFNADGEADILWRHATTGENYVWYMKRTIRMSGNSLPGVPDANWRIVGVADFNADGKVDILWRHATTGEDYVWFMNGLARLDGAWLLEVSDVEWRIVPDPQ